MSKLEKQKDKARSLETKDPKGAIEAWQEVLKDQEGEGEANPDLSIFNRIGDLYLKVKDPAQAADYYDRAVDKYAELGFHNNAIAMCNKVLRNAPGRQTTYLKLAKLYAAKGFVAEAKQNFVEYAGRMQKIGKIQHAFAALKEFTDISPENAHLRSVLEEHLKMYGDAERHPSARVAPAAPAHDDLSQSGKRKTSSLVFLDVDAPPGQKVKPTARPAEPPPRAREPESEVEAGADSLLESVTPEPDTSLEIESTSLAEGLGLPGASGGGGSEGSPLEGFETTVADFGQVQLDPEQGDMPSLRDEVTAEDVAPMAELEPTVPEDAEALEPEVELDPMLDHGIDVQPPRPPAPRPPPAAPPKRGGFPTGTPPRAAPRPVSPVVPKRPGQPKAPAAPAAPPPRPGVGSPPRVTIPRSPAPGGGGPPTVKPVTPKRPMAPPPAPARPSRKTVVEVPPLELEPDFDTGTDAGHDVDDQPLAMEDIPPTGGFVEIEEDRSLSGTRKSAFIDLGLDGAVEQGDTSGSLVFANIEATPSAPTIEELEGRVADDPDDPEAHQALGEALIEGGERDRGIEELDHATAGFENLGKLPQAQDLVEEILRLDPNSVRHRQKQVEYAFKSGDKAKLIDAYLELADTLLRQDLPDKARAVYQRVAEHDPTNERAKGAIAMLAPVAPAPQAKPEKKVAAKDAKMKVRDETEAAGDFVDLSAMVLEEEMPERDTRMKIADEEPTGDEERDFHDMLTRFRRGIEENIDEADFQSHYDLGIAFKEMGLLDEAIAELQKALRAPEGKLRVSEALGACFLEKGAYVVAESILRRALVLPSSGDQERLGILYWLGRALEEQGKRAEARELYGRVFAVDIRFVDVGERVKALARAK